MKYFKLVLPFAALFSLQSFGQTLSLSPAESEATGTPDAIRSAYTDITNNGDAGTFTWKRTMNDIPVGWQSSICDLTLCWAPAANAPGSPFAMSAGLTAPIHAQFDGRNYYDGEAHPIIGCGTVEVVFYNSNLADSATSAVTGIFTAKLGTTDCTLGFYSPALDNSFLLYPNPTKGYLSAVASVSSNIKRLEVINLVGKKVQSTEWNAGYGKTTINLTQLPEGIYFVKFIDKNSLAIYTEKITVIK